jgi:hypothetical protein
MMSWNQGALSLSLRFRLPCEKIGRVTRQRRDAVNRVAAFSNGVPGKQLVSFSINALFRYYPSVQVSCGGSGFRSNLK